MSISPSESVTTTRNSTTRTHEVNIHKNVYSALGHAVNFWASEESHENMERNNSSRTKKVKFFYKKTTGENRENQEQEHKNNVQQNNSHTPLQHEG